MGADSSALSQPSGLEQGRDADRYWLKTAFSCKRLLAYAVLFAGLFLVLHLAGARECANVLSGTSASHPCRQFWGAVYIIIYVCFVTLVPILLTAALLLKATAAFLRGPAQEGKSAE